ncbi:MAG TPA: HAMP domain-containing sensor histidine kinase [Candidatus Baltobacteraceae bacterium]|nr:HAMP domain-containing sensor histidine kinase [Candidatus Baltobacteraceae bacterium]
MPDASALLLTLSAFDRRVAGAPRGMLPVVVVRLPALERVAWRRGLRAARALERRASAAFSTAALNVLRCGDVLAHDAASDVFVAGLLAANRSGDGAAVPDPRSALARIAASMESATRLDVVGGWTTYDASHDAGNPDALIERALRRGAQERERYAFFSSVGHELRTPLASIRGYLETLLDGEPDDATRERFVRIAYNESLRLGRLIDGMFEISLLDLHGVRDVRASARVARAVRAAVDACSAEAAERSVSIAADEPDDELAVAVDVDRLTLVLVNLVGNAVKHGRPRGGVFIGVHVAETRTVCITVDDDGPGIGVDLRDRLFAFGARGKTEASGTGIGLALVRLVVERAGGRVDAGTSPLGGARFSVTLPRA